jgi:hypothetical protein
MKVEVKDGERVVFSTSVPPNHEPAADVRREWLLNGARAPTFRAPRR